MEEYLFTFGHGHSLPNKFICLTGTYDSARAQMVRLFGSNWAFQYHSNKRHELEARGLSEHIFFKSENIGKKG